jgi:4-hydroxybenzoate polyprenyltransferase
MTALLRLARPTHWVKNVFVAAPLLFVQPTPLGPAIARAALAFVAFSLLASAIYCFNDVVDAESDRAHPTKKARPVAAGLVSPAAAIAFGSILALAAILIAWRGLPPSFLVVLGLYTANNLLYNALIKRVGIADVIAIAIGFVLRLVAGSIAIDAQPSSWLLVCGFTLALFFGFGKRRSELALASDSGLAYRPVLRAYTPTMLDSLMSITATLTLMCYMLYTVSDETFKVHGTRNLVYTVPPAFYAIFRYILRVQEAKGESPEELLLRDPVMIFSGALWVALVALVLRLS